MTAHALDLGQGIELRCNFPALNGTVEVELTHDEQTWFSETFGPERQRADFDIRLPFLRADGALRIDMFAGELAWEGHLSVRLPGGDDWHEVLDVDHDTLLRFAPALGMVGASPVVDEPVVDDRRYGRSQLCTPAALRFFIEDRDRAVADVGQIVKREMFPDHPDFVFNTVACVGGVGESEPGLYTNPNSIWFNVFFGYYQLDCPKPQWSRPFGYRSAAGPASEIAAEDVVLLGKSDWNWFSNWMYGVPEEHVLPYSSRDISQTRLETGPTQRIGAGDWHELTMRGVEVASTYQSDAEEAESLTSNTVIDTIWRAAFGLPSPQPDFRQSFIPTEIDARVYSSYWEDDDAFHTVIFGGTAAVGEDPAFLEAQMEALREVIERDYPELGFPP